MNKPLVQRIALAIAFVFAGIAATGVILDAYTNSRQSMTPRIATMITLAIVMVFVVIEAAVRIVRFRWNFAGTSANLTRLGWAWRFVAIGVVGTLWLPMAFRSPPVSIDPSPRASKANPPLHPLPTDPLRFRYVTLDSGAARLFVARRIPEAWRPEISRNAFIVPNEPFVALQKLIPPPPEKVGSDNERLNEPSVAASQRIAIWSETTWPRLQSALVTEDGWNAQVVRDELEYRSDRLVFWRYANAADFEPLRDEDPEWIDFGVMLRRWHPPKTFAFVHLSENECEGIPLLVLIPRTLHLRLLVIDNASTEPVTMDTVSFRVQEKPDFRSLDEDATLLTRARTQSRALLPMGKLLPGERLIIPLQIFFRFEEPDDMIFVTLAESDQLARARYLATVRPTPDVLFDVERREGASGRLEAAIRLSGKRLTDILTHEDPLPDLSDELIAGPSVKVETVVAGGVARKVRAFNPQQVVVQGPSGQGSCPFVFTRAGKNDRWHSEGVILKANRGAANAGSDSRMLKHFDGRVILQELEPEVTTLDRAFVRATLPDGSTREFAARDQVLRDIDGVVATAAPRQPLAIDFEIEASIPGARYELVVHGYFTPLPVRRAMSPR